MAREAREVNTAGYNGPDRRGDGGITNGFGLGGMPAWLRVVWVLGPTSAIALFLVWIGAAYAPKIMAEVQANGVRMMHIQETLDKREIEMTKTKRMFRVICDAVTRGKDDGKLADTRCLE